MRLQIDTLTRRIRIEEEINLYKLFRMVNAIFPDKEWEDFTIESAEIEQHNWNEPLVIQGIPHNIPTNHPWIVKGKRRGKEMSDELLNIEIDTETLN